MYITDAQTAYTNTSSHLNDYRNNRSTVSVWDLVKILDGDIAVWLDIPFTVDVQFSLDARRRNILQKQKHLI